MLKRIILALAVGLWTLAPFARGAADPHAVEREPAAAHAAGGADKAVAHAGEHEKAPLLPDPLKRETQLHALWVVIIFLVLLAVLYPTAWKQVLAGLKAREQRIRKDIADAEAARARAEATLREYNAQLATAETRVKSMIADASQQAEKVAADIRLRGQREAEEARQRATRDIDDARKQALSEIYQRAAELSTTMAEKILRRSVTVEDQRELLERSLEQLESRGDGAHRTN